MQFLGDLPLMADLNDAQVVTQHTHIACVLMIGLWNGKYARLASGPQLFHSQPQGE